MRHVKTVPCCIIAHIRMCHVTIWKSSHYIGMSPFAHTWKGSRQACEWSHVPRMTGSCRISLERRLHVCYIDLTWHLDMCDRTQSWYNTCIVVPCACDMWMAWCHTMIVTWMNPLEMCDITHSWNDIRQIYVCAISHLCVWHVNGVMRYNDSTDECDAVQRQVMSHMWTNAYIYIYIYMYTYFIYTYIYIHICIYALLYRVQREVMWDKSCHSCQQSFHTCEQGMSHTWF